MKHPVHPDAMAREENIFKAAVQLADPAKRSACLDQACEGDTALRARIEKLLAVANDTFFDTPPAPGPLPASEGWIIRTSPRCSMPGRPAKPIRVAPTFQSARDLRADQTEEPVGKPALRGRTEGQVIYPLSPR